MYQDHSAVQITGQLLLALAFLASGVRNVLIAFTVLASLIFHRWRLTKDPLLRHLHIGNLLVNIGVLGGLLLVAGI